jgi:putative hydrolase of the HAD superfamily
VFDYGGVICFLPPDETWLELEQLTGLSKEALLELHRKHRAEWDRGAYNGPEFYRFILSSSGIFPGEETLERIVQADMDGWKHINPASIQLMRDIKASGLHLGILSNMPHDFLAWLRENTPIIEEMADTAVFSCNCNAVKPEAEIYKILREKIGCEYDEIIFFDDLDINIAKAKELGIKAFLWEGPDYARTLIAKMAGG